MPNTFESWPESLCEFRAQGQSLALNGKQIFVVDSGTRAETSEATPLLVLHGFPTSSFDFHLILPELCRTRRVVLFDFLGYGLSDKPAQYSYSLLEQADTVEMLAKTLGLSKVHLVAHDVGTSVACELLARRERGLLGFDIHTLTMLNGSVYVEMAHLTLSQRLLLSSVGPVFARAGSFRVFRIQMQKLFAQPIAEVELVSMWKQLEYRHGKRRLPALIHYVRERRLFAERWHSALRNLSDLKTLVLWGTEDPVAVLAIGERLAREIPGASLELLNGVGHYPQLEAPAQTSASINRFLESC